MGTEIKRMRPIRVLRLKTKPGNPIVLSLNLVKPKGMKTSSSKQVAVIRDYAAMPATVPLKMKDPGGIPSPGDIVECMCGTRVLVKKINLNL